MRVRFPSVSFFFIFWGCSIRCRTSSCGLKKVDRYHPLPFFFLLGNNTAVLFEVENECLDPQYPIYLSAQILAYSRVYMSRILRMVNGYLDPKNSFYYTDTDSLVLSPDAYEILLKEGKIGKELGQLSCDLSPKGFPIVLSISSCNRSISFSKSTCEVGLSPLILAHILSRRS